MSYRRKYRWFPRLALALAVVSAVFVGHATVAAAKVMPVAAAKVDEGTSSGQQLQVIPYLSHGILTQTDAAIAAAAAQPQKPRMYPYLSLWMKQDYSAWQDVPVRPDDVADRFTPSDVASQVEPTNGDNWRLAWSDALPLGIGIIVLGIALGLGLGYLRRPRLAGL